MRLFIVAAAAGLLVVSPAAAKSAQRISVAGEHLGSTEQLRGFVELPTPVRWTNTTRSKAPRTASYTAAPTADCSVAVTVGTRGVVTRARATAQVQESLASGTVLRRGRRHRGAWGEAALPDSGGHQRMIAVAAIQIAHNRYVQIRALASTTSDCTQFVFRTGAAAVGSERIVKDANVRAHAAPRS